MRIGIHLVLLFFVSSTLFAQYTDQINSNRPGESIGAFSVGTGVIQFEAGGEYRFYKHKGYNNSKVNGTIGFFSLRWGFLLEQLELTYEGSYLLDKLTSAIVTPNPTYKQDGFLRNFIGVKYLVYDPFKKEEEINVYKTTINELCEMILKLKESDLKVQYNPYSEDDARSMVKNRIGSRVKAEQDLGFKYKYELKEGLEKLIQWRIATGTDQAK